MVLAEGANSGKGETSGSGESDSAAQNLFTLCKFTIYFFLQIELPRCNFLSCASLIVVPKKCSILQIFVNFK